MDTGPCGSGLRSTGEWADASTKRNEAGHRLQQAATHKKSSTGIAAVWHFLLPYSLFPLDIVSRDKALK